MYSPSMRREAAEGSGYEVANLREGCPFFFGSAQYGQLGMLLDVHATEQTGLGTTNTTSFPGSFISRGLGTGEQRDWERGCDGQGSGKSLTELNKQECTKIWFIVKKWR